ncbi:hypothetical protein ZIOFF_051359 [Zingiber officinale]|uniref:Uncharacterized protein n=1 Tax=Zingiber officinale TaxID=94328 RepID=A0A8J5FIK5_ZINOF|nr:hypothetical protein ZIOFF_051359 [Zingiber officinale]
MQEVQQLRAESDEICSVLVEIMKDTKEKLIIAMENGQSRAEQLEKASTSGAKVIHSPLKVKTKGRPPTKRKQSKVEQIVNKSLAKARKAMITSRILVQGVAGSDPNNLSEVTTSEVAGLEEHGILLTGSFVDILVVSKVLSRHYLAVRAEEIYTNVIVLLLYL